MTSKSEKWIEHPTLGIGRIRQDRGDRLDIDFQSGLKTILKSMSLKQADPPESGFKFPHESAGSRKPRFKVERPPRRPPLDFDHLVSVFTGFFPDNFEGEKFLLGEREYKEKAADTLNTGLAKSAFDELLRAGNFGEICAIAKRVLQMTNLVYRIEKAQFQSLILNDPSKHEQFSHSLFQLLYGDDVMERRFVSFCGSLSQMGIDKWTVATYYQFLASRGKWMFMKPKPTKRIADSVQVALNYKAEPNWLTYSKLQEVADRIESELIRRGLVPRSRIDVQGFIWASTRLADGEY